jgi:hypothetical protein
MYISNVRSPVYMYIYIYMYVCISMYVCMYVCMYVYNIYIRMYTYIHTDIHTHILSLSLSPSAEYTKVSTQFFFLSLRRADPRIFFCFFPPPPRHLRLGTPLAPTYKAHRFAKVPLTCLPPRELRLSGRRRAL